MTEWTCLQCTFTNPSIEDICHVCEHPSTLRGYWRCELCTYKNEPEELKCDVCQQLREPNINGISTQSTDREDGINEIWNCEKCTFCNPSELIKCEMCLQNSTESTFSKSVAKIADKWNREHSAVQTAVREIISLTGGNDWRSALELLDNSEQPNTVIKDLSETIAITECPICYSDVKPSETLQTQCCGSTFCVTCINHHAKAILETGQVRIKCLGDTCDGFFTHKEISCSCGTDMLDTVSKRGIDHAVSIDPSLFNCPTPDCVNVISWAPDDNKIALFDCSMCRRCSCLACGTSPYHFHKSCEEHRLSVRTSEEEIRTREYFLKSNIRMCKKCGAGVVKSDGCDKMKCRCGYKFCYQCLTPDAKCKCTPATHGYWDNNYHVGDFN